MSEKIYRKNPDFVQREVAGEFILIPLKRNLNESNSLYVLNPVGAAVWKSFDGKRSLDQIQTDLLNEFEVAPERLESDLNQLLGELESIHAIQGAP